jgi:hypothetical protein
MFSHLPVNWKTEYLTQSTNAINESIGAQLVAANLLLAALLLLSGWSE